MNLKSESFKETDLGIKAVVSLINANGREIHRNEVKMWQAESRKAFIGKAIRAANGNLTENQRIEYRKNWDRWLRENETVIKGKLQQERLQQANRADETPYSLTEAERADAKKLLQSPSLLFDVGQIVAQLGLAGEKANALILYLVMTSRLLPNILSTAIKGESAVGKNTLIEKVSALFPTESYEFFSSMSRQALIYSDRDYKHKHIIIAEAEGSRAAEYNIRTLLSENRLVFETVEKNAAGQQTARKIEKEGPTGLITATTLPRLHAENETRLLSLSLDESEEQTENVKRATAAKYNKAEKSFDLTPWVNGQRVLMPVKVTIPFAEYLAEHTPKKPLRIRRDFNKLLAMIEASAVLHQHQRKAVGDGIIEASLADYFITKTLMEDSFFSSLYGLHPNTVAVMEAINVLVTKLDVITTRSLIDVLGWSKKKVLHWAGPLKDYDWVLESDKNNFNYQVGTDPRELDQRLPGVEELAEEFPDCAGEFEIIHPLTGDVSSF